MKPFWGGLSLGEGCEGLEKQGGTVPAH